MTLDDRPQALSRRKIVKLRGTHNKYLRSTFPNSRSRNGNPIVLLENKSSVKSVKPNNVKVI